MANQGGVGDEHSAEDLIAMLQSAVRRLQDTLVRHHVEMKESFKQVQETFAQLQENFARMEETLSRQIRETMGDISQIAKL